VINVSKKISSVCPSLSKSGIIRNVILSVSGALVLDIVVSSKGTNFSTALFKIRSIIRSIGFTGDVFESSFESWTFKASCPSRITIITEWGSLYLLPTFDSISAWHFGNLYARTDSIKTFSTQDSTQVLYVGVWRGEIPISEQICEILIEIDEFWLFDVLSPRVFLHSLQCKSKHRRRSWGPTRESPDNHDRLKFGQSSSSSRSLLQAASLSPTNISIEIVTLSDVESTTFSFNKAQMAVTSTLEIPGTDPVTVRRWLFRPPNARKIGG
jgi:hypothetical protein